MKNIYKFSLIVLACVAVVGLGFGVRALINKLNDGAKSIIDEQPVYTAENEPDLPTEKADAAETESRTDGAG